MRKLWVAVILLALFLVAGCTPEKPGRRTQIVRPPVEANATDVAIVLPSPAISADNSSGANSTDGTDGVRVRRLSDSEMELLHRNSEEYESLRERRYSTRIDLTQVDGYNCRSVIEQLGDDLERLARDVRDLDNQRRKKEQETIDKEAAYQETLASGDEFRIKTARFDWNDAENEYDDAKKAAKQAHDDYDETERTQRVVELECDGMRRKAGLPRK